MDETKEQRQHQPLKLLMQRVVMAGALCKEAHLAISDVQQQGRVYAGAHEQKPAPHLASTGCHSCVQRRLHLQQTHTHTHTQN